MYRNSYENTQHMQDDQCMNFNEYKRKKSAHRSSISSTGTSVIKSKRHSRKGSKVSKMRTTKASKSSMNFDLKNRESVDLTQLSTTVGPSRTSVIASRRLRASSGMGSVKSN